MKKQLYGIAAFLSLLIGSFLFASDVKAADLKIKSEPVNQEVTTQALKEWKEDVQNYFILDSEHSNLSELYLGEPFTINYENDNHTIYYPVNNENTLKTEYVLSTSDNNDSNVSFTVSKKIAHILENLYEENPSLKDESIVLSGKDMNVYYSLNGETKTLLQIDNSLRNPNIDEKRLTQISSIEKKIPTTSLRSSLVSNGTPPEINIQNFNYHVFPNWKVYELQTNLPWCGFYVMATILNNEAGKQIMTAKDVAIGTMPNATEQQREDNAYVSTTKIKASLDFLNKKWGTHITENYGSLLNYDQIKQEIDMDKPIYVALRLTSDPKSTHAIAMFGYIEPQNKDFSKYPIYYYYWNPWWEDTVISKDKSILKFGEQQYDAIFMVHNFDYKK